MATVVHAKTLHFGSGSLTLLEKSIAVSCRGSVVVIDNDFVTFALSDGSKLCLSHDGEPVALADDVQDEIEKIIAFARRRHDT